MTKLAKGLRLDLANSLARDVKRTADFCQGVLRPFAKPESHSQDQFLSRGERIQQFAGLLLEIRRKDGLDR